jgi:alpha-tubulin suppressor-like RCC1 family protein
MDIAAGSGGTAAVSDGSGGSGGEVTGDAGGIRELAAGVAHSCALLDGGRVRCWGWGAYGVLGYGNTVDVGLHETPAQKGDVYVGGKVVHIAAGENHTCAVLEEGRVRCWGWAAHGQLGYGNITNIGDDEVPAVAGDVQVGGKVVQLAAGAAHTCALLDTGAVRCWGFGALGQLGYANVQTIGDDELPKAAGDVNVGGRVVQITARGHRTCARLETGSVRCWGQGNQGELGYGNTNNIGDDETPAWAGNIDLGGTAIDISAGEWHQCAVLTSGALRCWGSNSVGQLGYGNKNNIGDDETPASAGDVNVGGSVAQVSASRYHTCARLEGGTVRCWGDGSIGTLGYGNKNNIGDNETPASAGDVNVGAKIAYVGSGGGFVCTITVAGKVRCWGGDVARGALGLGYNPGGPIGDDEFPAVLPDAPVE